MVDHAGGRSVACVHVAGHDYRYVMTQSGEGIGKGAEHVRKTSTPGPGADFGRNHHDSLAQHAHM